MAALMRRANRLSTLLLFGVASLCHAFPVYQEKYYNQTLDHFHPELHSRWSHRYLYNDESWTGSGRLPNGCRGPILLYTGNEGDITSFWSSNGFMIETLAPEWGALLVFPEARYYGKSLPFGDASYSTDNLVYLSTEQILEDIVELLNHLKTTLRGAWNCPVVAFGGSYGGSLTTFLRVAYPAVIVGGLASSAPIGYYDRAGWSAHNVTEYTWSDIVRADYDRAHPKCLTAISAASAAIKAASSEDIVSAFHVCTPSALGPSSPDELFAYALESLPQVDYPYQIGAHPAWPVRRVCEALVDASTGSAADLIRAAANFTDTFFAYDGRKCLPKFPEGPGGVPGDGPGPGPWGWQSCTETIHEFSSRGSIRNYTFDFHRSAEEPCQRLFNHTVTPDPAALAKRFGGYKIGDGKTGVDHLIWSNGGIDPWHGGGFLPWHRSGEGGSRAVAGSLQQSAISTYSDSGNHWIFMPNAAHHLDLRGPHPSDPPDVTAARTLEKRILWQWIQEASQASFTTQ